MKKIQLLLSLAVGMALAQNASAVIWRSSQIVGYNTGNLGTTGVGTSDGWENSTGNVTVTNGAGSLDGTSLGLAASAGDKVFMSATFALNARNLFVPANTFPMATVQTNIYFSFLYRFNNADDVSVDGEVIIRVNTGTSGTGTAQHWDLIARNVAGQMQVGIAKAGGVTNYASTLINAGTTFFVVVKQQLIIGAQNDVYSLWINPSPAAFGASEENVPAANAIVGTLTTDGTEVIGSGPGRFVVAAGANAQFDELRVASTWAEATPPVGSCGTAGIETNPTNLTQVAEISATFFSKASASSSSPTYQWQRSTNAGSTWNNIVGATTSTYTTPNLTLNDNGNQYRAIVNVTCDSSSATSGVATVTVTAPSATPVGLVMHDTFPDPEPDLGFSSRNNTPLSSSNSLWYTAASPQSLESFEKGGNLVGTTVLGTSSLWLGYFIETNQPPVHLSIGRILKVTLPFVPDSYADRTNNGSLRLGVFDYADAPGTRITADGASVGGSAGNANGVRGYMLSLDFGPNFTVNSPLQLLTRSSLFDNNLMGSTALYESLGSGPAGGGYSNAPAFQAGVQYTLEFSVARTDVNTVSLTTTITGGGTNWSHSVTETNAAYHRFDAFAIRANSRETSADSFTIPEFKVEVLQGLISVPPFNITAIQSLSPTSLKVTWNSVSGATYHVLSRNTLTGTETTNATIVATGSSTSYTNSALTGTERYYRVLAPPYIP